MNNKATIIVLMLAIISGLNLGFFLRCVIEKRVGWVLETSEDCNMPHRVKYGSLMCGISGIALIIMMVGDIQW